MAKKWRDDILNHDSKIANQSASKYLYPADLWSWLHAPTFASQRNSSITDFLNPYYNVTESKLTKQVECAQRVIAHVAVAVAIITILVQRMVRIQPVRVIGKAQPKFNVLL